MQTAIADDTCESKAWMSPEYERGLVSVIVPTYNRAHLITNALESVRRQTYRPIELIVVDDGSTDDTETVVSAWAAGFEDPALEVRYVKKENGGAPSARNEGLRQCRGEFIQYLDSDDLLHPEKVERQLATLRAEEADYVWSDYTKERTVSGNKVVEPVELGSRVAASAVIGLFKRSVVTTIGKWREDLPFSQDWNYTIRLLASRPHKAKVEGSLYVAREQGDDRITSSRLVDPDRLSKEIYILESTSGDLDYVCDGIKVLLCGKAMELMLKATDRVNWQEFRRARGVYVDTLSKHRGRLRLRDIAVGYMHPVLFACWDCQKVCV